jgi:integrase
VYEVVRRVFNWAVEEDILPASPCIGLKKPGVEEARDRVLSTEEIARVWPVLENVGPIGHAMRLLFYTGARRGEVLSMRWDELDLAEGLWRVPLARTKNKQPHVVPLSRPALAVLERFEGRSDWVFASPTRRGPIWSPQKAAERIRAKSRVDFRIHDIRRTVATSLAAAGTPSAVVSAILGHSPPGPVASQIYNRYSPIAEMRGALDGWARRLEQIATGERAKSPSVLQPSTTSPPEHRGAE